MELLGAVYQPAFIFIQSLDYLHVCIQEYIMIWVCLRNHMRLVVLTDNLFWAVTPRLVKVSDDDSQIEQSCCWPNI